MTNKTSPASHNKKRDFFMASGITTLRIVSHCPVLGRVVVQHRIVWKSPVVPAPVVVIVGLSQELTPAFVYKVKPKRLCVKSLFLKPSLTRSFTGAEAGMVHTTVYMPGSAMGKDRVNRGAGARAAFATIFPTTQVMASAPLSARVDRRIRGLSSGKSDNFSCMDMSAKSVPENKITKIKIFIEIPSRITPVLSSMILLR